MRKTAEALALAVLLITTAAGTRLVNLGMANPTPELYTRLTIENPKNMTYNVNTVILNFSVESLSFFRWRHFSYSLDGKELKRIANLTVDSEEFFPVSPGIYKENMTGNCVLPDLSEGLHNLTVYLIRDASTADGHYGETVPLANASFNIDTTQPSITILSLENKTRTSPDIKIDFTVVEGSPSVKYSLDGKENVTISENTTLTGLADGDHNVTIYATDDAGNTASQIVYFTVAEPFPTVLVAVASVAVVVAVGTGLLLYHRKRRKEAQQK